MFSKEEATRQPGKKRKSTEKTETTKTQRPAEQDVIEAKSLPEKKQRTLKGLFSETAEIGSSVQNALSYSRPAGSSVGSPFRSKLTLSTGVSSTSASHSRTADTRKALPTNKTRNVVVSITEKGSIILDLGSESSSDEDGDPRARSGDDKKDTRVSESKGSTIFDLGSGSSSDEDDGLHASSGHDKNKAAIRESRVYGKRWRRLQLGDFDLEPDYAAHLAAKAIVRDRLRASLESLITLAKSGRPHIMCVPDNRVFLCCVDVEVCLDLWLNGMTPKT
ncbi:uncharacterized protein BDZ99DRAFT_302413 [Mytilinidion resinicola]|uniref:Uncharacterized protein n=1 Tax=Mytilinidion resinicola TaxID=574789 RepID=A0A6A6YMD4_9PEZI|nr:uncharacterized protein BDZ99DRAFT_302413 [Mytilinidion resinicola]KAF2810036.1 hypothetical protein BDZ99DRAFT_302413 [Mytilinidion resinicola]